jgi:hypothetical protein
MRGDLKDRFLQPLFFYKRIASLHCLGVGMILELMFFQLMRDLTASNEWLMCCSSALLNFQCIFLPQLNYDQ